MQENEKQMLRVKKGDVPLESRRWMPLPGEWFLGKGEGRGATGNVPVEGKTEIFITFARGQNGDLTLCLFGRQRFI